MIGSDIYILLGEGIHVVYLPEVTMLNIINYNAMTLLLINHLP